LFYTVVTLLLHNCHTVVRAADTHATLTIEEAEAEMKRR
jgi:hypothetical protein